MEMENNLIMYQEFLWKWGREGRRERGILGSKVVADKLAIRSCAAEKWGIFLQRKNKQSHTLSPTRSLVSSPIPRPSSPTYPKIIVQLIYFDRLISIWVVSYIRPRVFIRHAFEPHATLLHPTIKAKHSRARVVWESFVFKCLGEVRELGGAEKSRREKRRLVRSRPLLPSLSL